MNSDSITRLTHGLFDDIDNLKSVDNYAYDKTNDFKQENSIQLRHQMPTRNTLYDYEQSEQYKDDGVIDSYDKALDSYNDRQYEKHKYDEITKDVENPLKGFYDELLNESAFKILNPTDQKKLMKKRERNSRLTSSNVESFDKFVKKIDKKVNKWIKEYDIFDYIVKSGKKYKIASSKTELDDNSEPIVQKLRYLEKLIKKSKFTEQVCKKFIAKYDMELHLISTKEINTLMKPFYEQCLIRAFNKKIRYSRH